MNRSEIAKQVMGIVTRTVQSWESYPERSAKEASDLVECFIQGISMITNLSSLEEFDESVVRILHRLAAVCERNRASFENFKARLETEEAIDKAMNRG